MKKYALIFLLLICLPLSYAQTTEVNKGYFEQISLITDRDFYVAGENVWFAIRCTDDKGTAEAVLSKIIYVELYDQRLNSIVNAKFRLSEGFATGYLNIPSGIQSGNYYLRAYTRFQRNFSPYAFSSKLLSVINPRKPLLQEEIVHDGDILAVPQGNKLIADVEASIAVRITPNLCKKTVDMQIVDDQDHVFAKSKPFLNGLALMLFTPTIGNSYYLKIILSDGKIIKEPLQAIVAGGISMKYETETDLIKISLTGDSISLRSSYELEVFSGHSEKLLSTTISYNKPVIIRRDQFSDGISYLLLTKDHAMVDFQSLFCDKSPTQSFTINTGQQHFITRQPVDLNSDLAEISGNGFATISVTLKGSSQKDEHLIPWHITYNPVLFDNYMRNTLQERDSLMPQIEAIMILYSKTLIENNFITTLTNNSSLAWLPETRDLGITGQIIDKNSRRPLNGIMVYASVIEDNDQVHIYKTSDDGRFYFTLNHLTGGQHVFISPRPVEGINMEMLVNSDFAESYPKSEGMIPFVPDSGDREFLNKLYLNAQVNKTFPTHITEISEKKDYVPLVKPAAIHTIVLDDYIELPAMTEVFSEIIPFVSLRKKNDSYFFTLFDDRTLATYTDPLVTLDGMPVFNLNSLMDLSPELIDTIELVNRTCYIGDNIVNGIIRIRTNSTNFGGFQFPGSSRFLEFQAITPSAYPDFPQHTGTPDRNPDFRTLLYWNAFVNKSNIPRFYTSDQTGTYDIIMHYFSGSGLQKGMTTFNVTR